MEAGHLGAVPAQVVAPPLPGGCLPSRASLDASFRLTDPPATSVPTSLRWIPSPRVQGNLSPLLLPW
jgi:hypothetical protein